MDAVAAIPFEPPCGDIHYSVISLLTRYKQYPPRYSQFLLQTLENPDADDRDSAIIKFLLIPGQLDDPAWNAALRAAGLSKGLYRYLDLLLTDDLRTEASRRRLQERIGIILTKVGQKKLGRPVPVEPGRTLIEILDTLESNLIGRYVKTKDLRPLMSCYQTYGSKYIKESDRKLVEILAAMFQATETRKDRELVQGWMGERLNQMPPSRELADVLTSFMRMLFEGRDDVRKTDATGGLPAQDLKRMAVLCGQRIAETLPFIQGRDYRLDITAFCLENGIKAPGIVPDLDTLGKDLTSEDETAQREAIRLLRALGPAALPVEPAVLKLLRRSENNRSWDDRNKYLQHDLLGLLGTLQTRNPEAHRLVIHQLLSIESYVADEAIVALVSIGEPAAAGLKTEFPRIEEAYKQMRIIKIFQLRGKTAVPHLPWLKSVMATTKSSHVRDAAEDAIDVITKG